MRAVLRRVRLGTPLGVAVAVWCTCVLAPPILASDDATEPASANVAQPSSEAEAGTGSPSVEEVMAQANAALALLDSLIGSLEDEVGEAFAKASEAPDADTAARWQSILKKKAERLETALAQRDSLHAALVRLQSRAENATVDEEARSHDP